jgi:hypothetical protein
LPHHSVHSRYAISSSRSVGHGLAHIERYLPLLGREITLQPEGGGGGGGGALLMRMLDQNNYTRADRL